MTNITKNINCFQLFIEYLTPFPKWSNAANDKSIPLLLHVFPDWSLPVGFSITKIHSCRCVLKFSRLIHTYSPSNSLYSGLNLNQYGVASPCRTICTVCGFVSLSWFKFNPLYIQPQLDVVWKRGYVGVDDERSSENFSDDLFASAPQTWWTTSFLPW